jgi:hypothetical protein
MGIQTETKLFSYLYSNMIESQVYTDIMLMDFGCTCVHSCPLLGVYMSLLVPYYMNDYVVSSLHPEQHLISIDPGLQSLK